MIKPYILIKTYPDSPELGTISGENTLDRIGSTTHRFNNEKNISQKTIESNPDFWKPLVFNYGDMLDNILNPPQTTRVNLKNIVHVNKYSNRYRLQDDLPSDFNKFDSTLLGNDKIVVTTKYAEKLDILGTLLCLRDLYNKNKIINTSKNHYIISNIGGNLQTDNICISNLHKVFTFRTSELRDLFLKNFKPQLELIKDLI